MSAYREIIRDALGALPAGDLRDATLSCFTPRSVQTVSEWADAKRVLVGGAEPGPFRTARVPYLRAIQDAISNPDVTHVVIMAGAQLAKSEALLNAIGYFAESDPSAVLLIQPTESAARQFSKERVIPMFEASPALAAIVSHGQKDLDATILHRRYPGGQLSIAWASSSVQLASRPIRVLLGDELDRWPDETVGSDGDPWAQACARTSTFGERRKVVAVSTPTTEDRSRIAKLYEDSNRQSFHVGCPLCGAYQALEWESLIYKNDAGDVDLDGIYYRCAHCDGRILERDKPAMLGGGFWKAEDPANPIQGFRVSALYSSFLSWRELVTEWVRATGERDHRLKRAFVNLRLARTWSKTVEHIKPAALAKNCEDYGDVQVPDGVLVLTCGVDVQDNRLELVVVGWGRGKASWAIEYRIVAGSTDDLGPDGPWAKLDAFLRRTWLRADGAAMAVALTFIDSLGHRTTEVLSYCREKFRESRPIYPCHGSGTPGRPIADASRPNASGYLVGTHAAKEAIYSRLAQNERGPGWMAFPSDPARGFTDEYFESLLSERLVERNGRLMWERVRRRNEGLDTFVYALAGVELLLLSWPLLLDPETAAKAAPRPRRRILSSGVSE